MPNIGGVRCVCGGGGGGGGGERGVIPPCPRSTSFSNKFLPFLEMQDVPNLS